MQRATNAPRNRAKRCSTRASSLHPQSQPLPSTDSLGLQHRTEWTANKDAGRLSEDILAPADMTLPRAKRVRTQTVHYEDTGASTRRPKVVQVQDSVDAVARILASLSQPVAPKDSRTTEEKHPGQARKVRMRNSASRVREREAATRRKQIELANLSRLKMELLLTKSWLDRKEMAFLAYATALAEGQPKQKAYEAAAKAAFVSDRTTKSWVPEYIDTGGDFAANSWGKNVSMPSAFQDTEVRLKGAKWWRDHAPKKGEPNARTCDFRDYILGIVDAPGPMPKVMEELDKDDYSEEMFRQFAIDLGFTMQDLRKGTFNDEHESDCNHKDRRNRFIPEYLNYFESSPHMYQGFDTDNLEDIDVRNRHFITITGTDNKVRKISLGGELPPGDGPVYLIASHDEERGLLQQGWHQPEMVQALQKCSDFQKKDIIERAAVTAQMQSYGYIALFGVKYHAELAHVERKWMLLKRAIRSKLDGTLPTLKRLLRDAWPRYTVGDARKAARHCRVSMKAYMVLGNTDLDTLREEELKMKGHRRVFDSVVGRFVMRAGLQQSARDRIYALRTEKARVHRLAKQEYDKRKELEWGSMLKRRARHSISDEDKIERNWNTKVRKAGSVITKKIAGDIVPEQTIKWATNILEKYHHD